MDSAIVQLLSAPGRLSEGTLPLPAPGGATQSLPRSLPEALDRLAANETMAAWFGPTHLDAYLRFKRVEWEKVAELSPAELCARYAEVY